MNCFVTTSVALTNVFNQAYGETPLCIYVSFITKHLISVFIYFFIVLYCLFFILWSYCQTVFVWLVYQVYCVFSQPTFVCWANLRKAEKWNWSICDSPWILYCELFTKCMFSSMGYEWTLASYLGHTWSHRISEPKWTVTWVSCGSSR